MNVDGDRLADIDYEEDAEETYENEDEDEVMSDAESEEKDETELELERLVFGDTAGFKEELKTFGTGAYPGVQEDSDEDEQAQLATLADADLFMVDTGDDQGVLGKPSAGTALTSHKDSAAWYDSDDDRRQISLMAVPRLRKLRQYEGEDVISAVEYTERLRRQFEVLHPRPAWADWTAKQKGSKKRRRSVDDEGDIETSDSDDAVSDDEEDEELSVQPLAKLLRSTESLIRTTQKTSSKRLKLRPEVISIERMKDITPTQPSAVTSLNIHPSLPLVLSSGPSSTLYLHHLRPHPTPPDPANPLVTSLHLKHTPLATTAFSSDKASPQIYLSGRRRYFHIWDLPTGEIKKITRIYGQAATQRSFETLKPSPCGRYIGLLGSSRKGGGLVNILSATTTQWLCQARLESRKGLADFAWWANGSGMCLVGRGGEVAEYNVNDRQIVARWQDEGAVGTTTIALGGQIAGLEASRKKGAAPPLFGTDRWIAIGSTSGIVNIYDRTSWVDSLPPAQPKPTKTFDHLTTPVSKLCFSPDGQVMAMASRWKKDALRLIHLPSCTVYRNWPTSKTPLGRISAVALGEIVQADDGGGRGGEEAGKVMILAVGNEAGALRAWEIMG